MKFNRYDLFIERTLFTFTLFRYLFINSNNSLIYNLTKYSVIKTFILPIVAEFDFNGKISHLCLGIEP